MVREKLLRVQLEVKTISMAPSSWKETQRNQTKDRKRHSLSHFLFMLFILIQTFKNNQQQTGQQLKKLEPSTKMNKNCDHVGVAMRLKLFKKSERRGFQAQI